MLNFDKIKEIQTIRFEEELAELQATCKQYPDIEEFVRYIVAFGSEDAYGGGGSLDARLGRDLIQFIYQISGMDLSNIGNSCHFDLGWVSTLNSFIGNYFLDDFAFRLVTPYGRNFEFESSSTCDSGKDWCQDPMLLIEAAKANRSLDETMNEIGIRESLKQGIKIDQTKVNEILAKLERDYI